MAPSPLVVRVLELRTQGADKVDEKKGRKGVEQMERGDPEMTDREKMIANLTRCQNSLCDECDLEHASHAPWDCEAREKLIDNMLELLKAQEPRVLSLEEVLGGDECWFEYINGSCGYVDVYMQDNKTAIIHRTNIRTGEVPITDYMKKWRCWSYRPTDEQRKAVKWDDSD